MSHRAVICEDKSTTKVRVVFDASTKSSGPSLNDFLYEGPEITLLYNILLTFRCYPIALSADIAKAFLGFTSSHFHLNASIREHTKLFELHLKFTKLVEGYIFADDFTGGENSLAERI